MMIMYYISVSNGLLKNGHRKRMGAAVWEFMWLIDKITKIDNKGYGLVLGGRPIKLEEIAEDLGVHRDTVSDNLSSLESEGYIIKTIAPYGIAIKVAKAKKRFGKTTEAPGSEKTPNRHGENTEPRRENTEPNKTRAIDNTHDNTLPAKRVDESALVINLFKAINSSYQLSFARKSQRAAAKRLLDLHGLEKLEKVIGYIAHARGQPYFPTITTPCQLEEKWSSLESYALRQKNKQPKANIAFQ